MSNTPLPARDTSGDVLIVGDTLDTVALYEALLSRDGHRVRTASTAEEALNIADQREPELVLLDLSTDHELLRRLRARRGGGPAVIMLTAARREMRALEEGLREGADAYLTKPIDARELLARTRAALETFRLRRMLEAQRRDHVAMLVHDLRHPLSSLALVAEILDSEDLPSDERRAATGTIRALCTDMARLIDGVLAASRLEAGVFTVDLRPVTVGAVLDTTLAAFAPIATRRRVALTFEGSPDQVINADTQKLRQAIDNLVANALKFTPRDGQVRVRVFSEENRIIFDVSDTGPGIAEHERAAIFDRYRQGSRGRAAGGAGLGLAIARGIAEAHGGEISVGSSDLGGATFRIAIPA